MNYRDEKKVDNACIEQFRKDCAERQWNLAGNKNIVKEEEISKFLWYVFCL